MYIEIKTKIKSIGQSQSSVVLIPIFVFDARALHHPYAALPSLLPSIPFLLKSIFFERRVILCSVFYWWYIYVRMHVCMYVHCLSP